MLNSQLGKKFKSFSRLKFVFEFQNTDEVCTYLFCFNSIYVSSVIYRDCFEINNVDYDLQAFINAYNKM